MLLFAVSAALSAGEVSLSIRYYDMRIYYLNTDPILVQVTITNNGPDPYRFKLADERVFSLDFDVRTTTNRSVEAADWLIRRRSTAQQIYFRDILVEAGESFSFVEDLRDYSRLSQSGVYVVQAKIYPELYQATVTVGNTVSPVNSSNIPLESNRLSLSVRLPPLAGPDGVPMALDVETNAILVREPLPPDEVVSYILTARQKEQWEKFFLYLDLEAMLSRDAARRRQWIAESEEGRQRMLDRYRRDLQSAIIDGDISTIPKNFIIERTAYGVEEGTVTVLEYFQVGQYTERKRYTYYLRRSDNIWTIVDYVVVNLGTE
jgi:hypothetical protein